MIKFKVGDIVSITGSKGGCGDDLCINCFPKGAELKITRLYKTKARIHSKNSGHCNVFYEDLSLTKVTNWRARMQNVI